MCFIDCQKRDREGRSFGQHAEEVHWSADFPDGQDV